MQLSVEGRGGAEHRSWRARVAEHRSFAQYNLGLAHALEINDMIGRALEQRQARSRAGDDTAVRSPPAVEPADEPGEDEHTVKLLGERETVACNRNTRRGDGGSRGGGGRGGGEWPRAECNLQGANRVQMARTALVSRSDGKVSVGKELNPQRLAANGFKLLRRRTDLRQLMVDQCEVIINRAMQVEDLRAVGANLTPARVGELVRQVGLED